MNPVPEIPWRLAPLDDPGLPAFIAAGALPDPAIARCERCDARPRRPLSGSGHHHHFGNYV